MSSLFFFSYKVSLYCSQKIDTITFNSEQGPTQEFKIVCLQNKNFTGASDKRHAKTKRMSSYHGETNFLGRNISQASLF